MPKDDVRYVGHMVDCARRVEQFVAGKSRPQYDADEVLRLAIVHLIQTIGEAAGCVSADFQQQNPQVPWPQIIGMRNRIVHDYLNVDYDIAWQVATRDIGPLVSALAALLPPLS
ncbi:MAG: HepT-like ribonuclease domain-containing protein [Pirellulales bacterium]|nr:HepT-like ribonuclease domain-containing protein [Pirellulales bacterium]